MNIERKQLVNIKHEKGKFSLVASITNEEFDYAVLTIEGQKMTAITLSDEDWTDVVDLINSVDLLVSEHTGREVR